jgi:26S proteasome regulatory subunit T5
MAKKLEDKEIWKDAESDIPEEILRSSDDDIVRRARMIDNEAKVLKNEAVRLTHEHSALKERIKENTDKIKLNKQLPYLVGNVVEILDLDPEDEEEDGSHVDLDSQRKGRCTVIKTSTRQTIFLPVVGLVDSQTLKPGDLVGVNKDSYLILDTLPAEYDSRVKAMEVDEKPTEDFTGDVGGLDKQIEELIEAVILPMTQKERFQTIWHCSTKGCVNVWTPRYRKDSYGKGVRCSKQSCFLEACWPTVSADVYWRWR